MAILSNPFVANIPKQLSNEELLQALRTDIIGEYEAVIGYEAHAQATTDSRAKQILLKLADDERKHIGQLQELLTLLSPKEGQLLEQGKQVVEQQNQSSNQSTNPLVN